MARQNYGVSWRKHSAILLVGCSSYSSMTNVYILGLSYTNSTPSGLGPVEKKLSETLSGFKGDAQLEVRTGYFGMCVRQRGVLWLCSADTDGLAQQIGPENDALNLIGAASKFRNDVLFSGLFLMAIVLSFFSALLMATFPGWRKERDDSGGSGGSGVQVKTFPSRPVSQAALSCASVAATLCLVASLWQHVGSVGAAAMAETANYGNLKTDIGVGAIAMAWIGFSLMVLVASALLTMIQPIQRHRRYWS
ncbi:hypothetical protein BU26DRAFT_540672 [Trematosphaeria pertusa]|uniref:Membrane fusion mating protein FIG1 n=1 Tax=Trematosphaeria pertusa TaxID=390896 RepID=A0A6A6IIR1_9PLEO|nr:uncharacterized protein BU26DRAFT_540672 [Trematosphaeria pertusa]KAF2249443.1 hypothetical protein BU26DRAFT_540672 [Trematosphaeria pertusa]